MVVMSEPEQGEEVIQYWSEEGRGWHRMLIPKWHEEGTSMCRGQQRLVREEDDQIDNIFMIMKARYLTVGKGSMNMERGKKNPMRINPVTNRYWRSLCEIIILYKHIHYRCKSVYMYTHTCILPSSFY